MILNYQQAGVLLEKSFGLLVYSTLGDHDGLSSRDEKGGTDENG